MYLPEQPAGCSLRSTAGENLILQSVNIDVTFDNLLCETTMTQVYQNLEEKPIEAVYNFPLTSQAVLLGLSVRIGDRELQGVVAEKGSAEERYEEAISDGDSAIMLEQIDTGLYTMNVGNILAGESVSITITYAELYSWQKETLRFHLPTTIAPRYGDSEAAGLQPHQLPEHDFLTENRFTLKVTITGALANAEIECPTHNVSISRSGNRSIVTLATGETSMDRDFILNITTSTATKDTVIIDRDLDDGFVALASFAPRLPRPHKTEPKSIKIVVDCSGSMSGDSITQARQAISEILKQLRPEDFFNLVTFGSTCKTYFSRQLKADKRNITKVRRRLRSLDADMGGTEMHQALQTSIQLPGPPIPADILLITDGEIWESEELINMAKKSNHRIFTVGVGSSVAEGFVRQLAKATGGACELVTPNEKMAEKIVRHFNRIYLPQATDIAVRWPLTPDKKIPDAAGPIFDGDTLHLFAFFSEKPQGSVTLDMSLANGERLSQTVTIPECSETTAPVDTFSTTIARMAISSSLTDENEKTAMELAVKYQLVSPYTNYLIVDAQNDEKKTGELPLLRKVPQMSAAGWGGAGTIIHNTVNEAYEIPCFSRTSQHSEPAGDIRFCLRPNPEQVYRSRQQTTPAEFIKNCNRSHQKRFRQNLEIKSFEDLLGCDLPDRILDAIKEISSGFNSQLAEDIVVLAFLTGLSQTSIKPLFTPKTLKAINRAKKKLPATDPLTELFRKAFTETSDDNWGPGFAEEFKDHENS